MYYKKIIVYIKTVLVFIHLSGLDTKMGTYIYTFQKILRYIHFFDDIGKFPSTYSSLARHTYGIPT